MATLFVVVVSSTAVSVVCADDSVAHDSVETGERDTAAALAIPPFLGRYCARCHNEEERESGIRVDHLDGTLPEPTLKLWEEIREQIDAEAMPPEEEKQPTQAERRGMVDWIDQALRKARSRKDAVNGSVRRLTVPQYRNTLQELLWMEDDFTSVLPPDGVSKDGFTNDAATLSLSPLEVESWFEIGENALDACFVDEASPPTIQNFRMDLGKGINSDPWHENLILGANNHLLANADFLVTELDPVKPFEIRPFRMRAKYRFHEGYKGNSTVRGWRDYDSIYHSVFACMRGNRGYPKGLAYETVEEGLLLRPAIPSSEIFRESSTYGPQANFKIALRELPEQGRFRVRIVATKYRDGLLLTDANVNAVKEPGDRNQVVVQTPVNVQEIVIPSSGIYQIDAMLVTAEDKEESQLGNGAKEKKEKRSRRIDLEIDGRQLTCDLKGPAFAAIRLPSGTIPLNVRYDGKETLERLVLTRLDGADAVAQRFEVFEQRDPKLGVFLGLRRDCGHTFRRVQTPRVVGEGELREFIFEGAINNYPRPHVQENNDNYLAGVREISVRCDYTDGRDTPRLLIRSVEFEGPFYETWPPKSHRAIFVDSPHKTDSVDYAREVVRQFATRAFRRPVTDNEFDSLMGVWQDSIDAGDGWEASIKKTLTVVLTSPPFLFLVERSQGPQPEDLDAYELASKLSYFLWNGPPDHQLLELARDGQLRQQLRREVDRMVADPKFERFAEQFASEWLSLDKFDVVETDRKQFPSLSSSMKRELRREPAQLLQYLFQQNLSTAQLVRSEFVMANERVASYYGLESRTESGFEFVPVRHADPQLGGVLSQAAILAGLSDGREANPVKRGAWFARKIIAEAPDDPPPNVPELEDDTHLSLRERLERHRSVKGCVKCHERIDPWGLAFEQFDAGGRFQGSQVDAASVLPDGTQVDGLADLRNYLADQRMDQVAFGLLRHMTTYAIGRGLTYGEERLLRRQSLELKSNHYPMKDMIQQVVQSDLFLKK
ncbi:MAG: DUF1592 domain-containing protein [Rubripirellula sp.]